MATFKILILVAIVAKAEILVTPPVLIWGKNLLQATSVFQAVSTDQFVEMLMPLQKKHMIIAYFSLELTTKDLSCIESDCYPFLHQVEQLNYYSQVNRPLVALNMVSHVRKRPLIWNNEYAMLQLSCDTNQIYAFNFTNKNLTDHDSFMATVSGNLIECPVIQLYTGHEENSELLQRRRQRINIRTSTNVDTKTSVVNQNVENNNTNLNSDATHPGTVLRHLQGLIALKKIVFADEIKRGQTVYYNRSHIYLDASKTTLRIDLADEKDIKKGFAFVIDTPMGFLEVEVLPILSNWRVSHIAFQNITFKPRDLVFYSKAFSLCCHALTAYSDEGSRISIYSLNMDVIINTKFSALDADYIPKPCWLCEEYMSPGITQALFTVIILISLVGIGISMIFNMGRSGRIANANEPDMMAKGGTER